MSETTKGAVSDEPPLSASRLRLAFLEPAWPHIAAVALLAGLLAVFFYPLSIQHKVLSPADLIYGDYPWAPSSNEEFQPSNRFQSDDAYLYYPRREAFYEPGGDAWWQDDYLSGYRNSFSADFIGLDFYPPSLMYRVLPFPVANGFFHAAVLLVAGVGMYLLLWQLKFPWLARVYGGMLLMLNGHFVVWLGAYFLPATLGLVPLMMFGFERYFGTRKLPYLLVPAASFAMQIYLGYIPAWVVSGLILGVYGGLRLAPLVAAREWWPGVRRAGAFGGAAVLGALLGAYALLPSVAAALDSSYQQDRALGLSHLPLENAWTFLFPDYWGTEERWIGVAGNYPEWVAYAAITAAPLALLGFWHMRRHWLGWFSAIVLIFCAAQVFGIPPLKELAHVPGLKQVAAGRWLFGLNLVLALMAPAGLAMLLSERTEPRVRYAAVGALAAAFAAAMVAVAVLSLDSDDANWVLISEGEGLVPAAGDLLDGYSTQLHRQVGLLFVATGLAAFALVYRAGARPLAVGIVALAFVDLLAFGDDYNGTIEREELYPATPGIEFLREDAADFRIAPVSSDGGRQVFPGYTANLFGLRTITGYDHYRDEDYLSFIDPLRSRTDREITDLYGYVPVGTDRVALNPTLLRLLNVKYVVTEPAGLYESVGGQDANATVFPVYGNRTQGQTVAVGDEGADAVELLLATGGGPAPESEINFHVRSSARSSRNLVTATIDGRTLEDNSWHVIHLPDLDGASSVYLEIEAPDASEARPLLLWGIHEAETPGRFDSGSRVPGSLTYRVLESPDWAQHVYAGEDIAIYEVEDGLPVAWGVGEVAVVEDMTSAIEIIADDEFDPATTVILTRDDAGSGVAEGEGGTYSTEIIEYGPDKVRVHANFSEDGWVVLSNRYDGGWQAEVDGEDAELYEANGILQAVAVEAGVHEIEVSFRPRDYVWGQRISVVTLISLLVAGMAYAGYSQRRRFSQQSEKVD